MNSDNPSDISATVELFKDLDITKDIAKKFGTCFYNNLSKYWKILSKITTLSTDTKSEIEKYKTKINNLKDRNIRNSPEKDLQDITDILYFLYLNL